jgi:hypothetical protein
MQRTGRQWIMYVLAILFAAGPIVAGLIRSYTANDARLLWMALASLIGVSVTMFGRPQVRGAGISIGRAVLAFLVGVVVTLLADVLFIGARAFVGILLIAIVMSFFWAMAYVLHAMSKAHEP